MSMKTPLIGDCFTGASEIYMNALWSPRLATRCRQASKFIRTKQQNHKIAIRECVRLVTGSYFRSRKKDGGRVTPFDRP